MQVYSQRTDARVTLDIFKEILSQVSALPEVGPGFERVKALVDSAAEAPNLTDREIRRLLPEIKKCLGVFARHASNLFIFLDDFHVLNQGLQPEVLGHLYGVCRGNNVFLKLSSIEKLTRTWNPATHTGLEIPHDAQTIRLDYNLTMPDKAAAHIASILDAHASYCGLPSVTALCTSADVMPRLVWVSAGVPRDAINIFAQAMTKGSLLGQRRVSVTNINVAGSELTSQKLRDLNIDTAGLTSTHLQETLEAIKDFCIKQKHRNAFLVEIRTKSELYQQVSELVDLRLLHVINEGITVAEAGRKYLALILDYGFYTGIRAAQSVELFNKQTRKLLYKDLRKLPVFSGGQPVLLQQSA
jgi:hypothetical protein